MADVSRSVYLSRKLSNVVEESSKHVYDGVFSAPAATKHNASNFAARIDEYREIFPPSKASLGSTIPILDLPAVDRSVGPGRGVSSGFDYAGVFGGFGDNDGIEFPSEELFRDSKKAAKRDAQPPRIPAPTRRMPSKSQEFSCSYGNDQTSSPGKTRRVPSKSQEFSCNYENDQTSSPAQARRVPSKSQEFSSNYGNDQTSSPLKTRRMPSTTEEVSCNYVNDQTSNPGKTRRMPSKSQEFSCNFGTDQKASPAQPRRMPSKGQEFPCNYGNDQTSSPTQTRRMPSTCEEVSCDYVNDQTSNPGQTRRISSKCQESSCNHGNDQTSSPAQTRRLPSKSQEFPCNYGDDQTSNPAQMRRVPSKSQEFSCNYANDKISSPAQPRMQHSRSQEFSSCISNNQMSTNPLQTRRPFLNGEDDKLSGTSPNDLTSASALPHQTVDSVKHVSVSYNKTNQLSKDGPNGMTHIAHLHAVPGYTLLFDEAGPVRKSSFDKAKRLSMDDADFCGAVGKVSRQGKHTRAVSDLGTNQQASDHDPGFQERFGVGECDHFVNKQEVNCKPQTRSMSASNSPQSFGSSGYSRRSSRRRPTRSTNKQERNASGYLFPLLDEELDVNSAAAVSAAAVKRAIEEAEEKMRWAREFLKDLEGSGFIKATLKDSFKVKVKSDNDHSYETYGPKQNVSLKVKATRKKKCFNEEVLIQNGYLNSKASGGGRHANEAGEIKPKVGLEITSQKQLENESARLQQKLHVLAAGVDTTMRSPASETFEETNAHDELKYAEKSCKDEGGGEWEAAKHLSQLFTGVKNRFVSFMSKQTDTEKRVIQKDAPNKCESLEQSRERAHEVRNVDNNQEREADLDHIEEKVEMNRSVCAVAGESAQDFVGSSSADMEICEAKDNEVNTSGSTSCPDIDMLTSQKCRPSEPEEELGYIETQESANITNDLNQDMSTEVKGELLQEVRELNQGMLDETVKIEHEIQMGTVRLEECEDVQEKACQSEAYDDKVKNREDNEEIVDEVPDVEPVEKGVDESLNNEVVTSRQIEGCNLTEIEMPKDAQMKQEEDVRIVEETCMVEECYERRVGAEEIYRGEDAERITGEATECLIEVVDDVSQPDEQLSSTDDISDHDELFLSKKEASVPDNMSQYVQGVKFSSEEKGRMTESATVPFDPKEDVEHPQSVQRTNELIGEGVCEQTPCSIEVVDDDSEHDEYLPAVDDILEQDEFLSSSRNEEASVPDIVSHNGLDVDLPSQKGRLTEATSVTFEPKGNTERSRSVQMADELNGECSSENSGSRSEAADESLEHDDYLPTADDVFEKDEHSGLNRNAETGDQDENQYAQEGKVAVVKERMTTGGGTSEYERTEQRSSRQRENNLMGEELTKTSISTEDRLDLDNTEKEIEEANDASPCTDVEMTERDTVLKYEQKHSDDESKNFASDIGPENQDDESEVSTREANEHDASSHNSESSHKRRRWFASRVEVVKFQRPGIFQGNERTVEMDQENAESLAVEDRVEICADEIVNNPDEDVRIEQADADSDQDQKGEGLQSNEGAHRRRRWFENSGEKVQLKPSPSNGIGVTALMDHEITHDFEHDVTSQTVVDKLVNERKYGADGMECSNMTSDKVESRASTEAGHRRRRWFEKGENLGAAQAPGPAISEDNGATATLEEEIKVGEDTTKQELHETSSSEESTNAQQSEGHSKAREKEKERLVVERAIREARQRAFAEARERAAAEARLKAAAAAQDRPGKASSEAKPLSDKASMDAKLRAERAAVERATAEARERALQKSVSEKVTFKSREKVDFKNLNSGPSSSGYSTSVPFTSDRPNGAMTESPQRKKAILERNNRISEKASKALEEKNMRDVLLQKEQAERSRFAGVLDAEVKRWLTGKEGNLRSLLSTLQYVLGPESGWQPIPLTDLVTTTAVRKAYKRAALCVHPDKLQQRRATVQQKYICEKVFDLLKDAWHKFNPEDR